MNVKPVSPEEVVAAAKAGVEFGLSLANVAFVGVERLSALNLNTVRAALEDLSANVKLVMAVKDVQGVAGLQDAVVKPSLDKVVAYSKSVYELAQQTQEEVAKLVEAKVAELNKSVAAALEAAAKSAPVGSDAAVAAVKQVLAAADAAYANVNKAVKQVAEVAEANVAAATKATMDAVGQAAVAPKAKKAA
ncbi:MAG: phasin family protein [Rhodocyclaceae bacterium]|nr:phasin family protein [Rhodocyclaceae bacterium]MBX3667362.1 phasin family protein [Rhodocyclaceae bacterium]